MKKSMIAFLCLTAILLTACGKHPAATDPPATTAPTASPTEAAVTAPPQTPTTPDVPPSIENMFSASMPIRVETRKTEYGTVLSSFSSQEMELIIPDSDVAENIKNDFYGRIELYRMDAEEVHARAEEMYQNGGLPAPLSYDIHYDVMRIDQGILSLYGELVFPSDGARNSVQCVSACYNLISGDVLTLGSILYRDDCKKQLEDLLLAELNTMKDEFGLYEDFAETVKDDFSKDESTLENFYFTNTGLCFYFSPSQIASRTTGPIIAEIPYQNLVKVIGDEFFPGERTYTKGSVNVSDFTTDAVSKYQQFAQIIASDSDVSQKILLTCDSKIQNVRIHRIIRGGYAAMITDTRVIYVSNMLSSTNAILFEAEFIGELPNYAITYTSEGVTKFFCFKWDAEASQIVLTETDDPILLRNLNV